jgi:hypothetical protein
LKLIAVLVIGLSALVDISLYDLFDEIDTSVVKTAILDELKRHSFSERLATFQVSDYAKRLAIYASFVLVVLANIFVESHVQSTVKALKKIHSNLLVNRKKFDGAPLTGKGRQSSADVALKE